MVGLREGRRAEVSVEVTASVHYQTKPPVANKAALRAHSAALLHRVRLHTSLARHRSHSQLVLAFNNG